MEKTIKILTLMLSVLLLNFLNPQTTKAQCHIDEWTALKALYESTNGDNWLIRSGWDTMIDGHSSPPANCNLGNLYGVSLNVQERVTCIDLDGDDSCRQSWDTAGNNLEGHLPIELGNITYLKELHLSYNLLSGNIPKQLGDLASLSGLTLRDNFLSGSIPPELGNLSFLKRLDLGFNQLEDNIPPELGNLSFINRLDLSGNLLTGTIPPELGNLNLINDLLLYNNFLSGSIPPQLGNLTQLTNLALGINLLSGALPVELSNLINLVDLYLNENYFSGPLPGWLGNLINIKNLILRDNEFSGNLPPEFCNLSKLTFLEVSGNNLTGSYPPCYTQFCTQLTSIYFDCNIDISGGNNFDITWEEFCNGKGGKCDVDICGCTDPNACNYNPNATCDNESCLQVCDEGVYPGDLNNDGIVNNQDVSLSGLFQYQSGTPRASSHQNTEWYPHPAQDWGILNNQNKDIKHHDCNGDGVINEADQQAVQDNMGFTCCPSSPPPPPDESDYQVMLHPIDEIYDGYLVMNVALERREGGDLTLQGGHFTVDYSDVVGDFSFVGLNFEPISWLGTPTNNLWYESTHLESDKKIEVGFTKTNNTNSMGRGVIGQLILQYDNSSVLLSDGTLEDNYQFRVHTIGMHQSDNTYILIEDQQLQVNLTSNCEPNWNINEDSPFQNLYQSSNNLTTNGFVIIGEDQEVEYKADRVRINSGFSAKAGAKFKVRTGGCN